FPPSAKLACPCAFGATPVAWSGSFTVAACTAGTASRAMIVNTKDFITTPLRFSDALFARSPYPRGSPTDAGLPYDFRTTPAAASEVRPSATKAVALIFVGADGRTSSHRTRRGPRDSIPMDRAWPPPLAHSPPGENRVN